jgi:hypothetical protein
MFETGKIARIPISLLRLDPENPRLPEEAQEKDQSALAKFISRAYEPISVAMSIAEHGFFESEPLIAFEESGTFTVVEGNRRLTALLGLTDPGIRSNLDSVKQWEKAAQQAVEHGTIPEDVPVLVVPDRKSVAPIIGFRHISGILPWESFAKARFIAGLVEDEGLSFADVGSLVGETKGDIASAYRNYAIVRQARSDYELDTDQVEDKFGVFTQAMGQIPLRAFIGAPGPQEVVAGENPIPEDKTNELREFLTWIGGDSEGRGRVIEESRELRILGIVVSNEAGLKSLR